MWLCLTWNQARSRPALANTGLRCLHLYFHFYSIFLFYSIVKLEISYRKSSSVEFLGRRQHLDHFTQLSETLSQRSQLQVKMDGNDDNISIVFLEMVWFKPKGGSCRPQDASSTLSATTCTLDPYAKVTPRVKFSSKYRASPKEKYFSEIKPACNLASWLVSQFSSQS